MTRWAMLILFATVMAAVRIRADCVARNPTETLLPASSSSAGPSADARRTMSCAAFRSDVSAASLAERFGASNVTSAAIELGEGETEPGTVLFADAPEDRLEVIWSDRAAQRTPAGVFLRGAGSRWQTPGGLTLGLDLRHVERLNRRPFRLLGFSWDYAGTVMSWSGGRLGAGSSSACREVARFSPARLRGDEPWTKWYGQVMGDREFSSGHPAMQAINPVIYEVSLHYPREPSLRGDLR